MEAAHGSSCLVEEDLLDALEAAGTELAVVLLVPRGCASEHDVVSVLAARDADLVVLRIVLEERESENDELFSHSSGPVRIGFRHARRNIPFHG